MKHLHWVHQDGKFIGTQMAKTPERACYLLAKKRGLDWQTLVATRWGETIERSLDDWEPIEVDDAEVLKRIKQSGGTILNKWIK